MKPERASLSYQLNELVRMIFLAAYPRNAHHRREHPAQFIVDKIRGNFRAQGRAFALLAKHVKLALPTFELAGDSS